MNGGRDLGGPAREASPPGDRARPVRDEHAEGARRHRDDDAPAGPGLRADRPGHERARLVRPHAPGVGARGRLEGAARALDRPLDPRRAARVLRDHRGGRRFGRGRDRDHRAPRRRRLRDPRREDARDLVQHRGLPLRPGQDRRGAERRRPRDVLRGQGHARRAPGPRARLHPHVPRHARDRGVRRRARPRVAPGRRRRATAWSSRTSGSATSG